MTEQNRNASGLFDIPVRFPDKERVTLTRADIERQLDAGAILMSREEAIAAGFLNPLEAPDAVLVDITREDA